MGQILLRKLFVRLLMLLAFAEFVYGKLNLEERGPVFSNEPPGKVIFANTKGTRVNCAAAGSPIPTMQWISADGNPVVPVPGLREIESGNAILVLKSFSAEQYRPDVHSVVYRCTANNSVGMIVSGDVQVRGVVLQSYDLQVYDTFAIEGNTAVFTCHIPQILRDFIKVSAWIKNDNLLIQTSDSELASEKYVITQAGDLLINEVSISEGGSQYKCKTTHKLTNESSISKSGGRLFVTAPHNNIATKILDLRPNLHATPGEYAVISCVAQGFPVPTIKWFRKEASGKVFQIEETGRFRLIKNLLRIENVQPVDKGEYICEATSSVGKDQAEVFLHVLEPLKAEIQPQVQVAKTKESVSFQCETTGGDRAKFAWLYNGKLLQGETGSTLNVQHAEISNRGMYQCVVEENNGNSQATVELRLSDFPPMLSTILNEMTLQPGGRVNLECSAGGMPLPEISWDVDGVQIESNANIQVDTRFGNHGITSSSLTIQNARVEDGGLYSCTASNQVGENKSSARINIFGPVRSRSTPTKIAVSGADTFLNCPYVGHPVSSISWHKGGKALPASLNQKKFKNGTLLVREVSKSSDVGTYECSLTTPSGNVVQSKVELKILVPPQIIPFAFLDDQFYKGMRAHITCAVSKGDLPITFGWLKDEQKIPFDLNISIKNYDQHASTLSIENVGSGHSGNYTCAVTNRAATAAYTAPLLVRVPPKIVPFGFQDDHLLKGNLARVSCVISRGDLPLNIRWEKDGAPIPTALGVMVTSFDEHSSILTIESVAERHNGQYSCIVSNAAGMTNFSAEILVKVPPSWIKVPQDESVLNDQDLTLDCQASGYPKPTISWLHTLDQTESEPIAVEIGEHYNVLLNGSLHIRKVDKARAGYYFCKASNGIGSGLNTMVVVKIHAPPTFKTKFQMASTSIGKEYTMNCNAYGDASISAKWYKDGRQVSEGSGNRRFKIVNNENASGISSSFTIFKSSRQDQGKYECVVENTYGKSNMTFELVIQEIPESPKDIKVSVIGSRIIELSWQKAFDGNDPITKYIIEYITEFEDWEKFSSVETSGEILTGTVSNLKPSNNYLFRIFAENRQGRSKSSSIVKGGTADEAPYDAPKNVQVSTKNDDMLAVSWMKSPSEQSQSGRVTGYYVGYKEEGKNEPFSYKTLMTLESENAEHSIHISNLKKFTKYSIIVQAYNEQGIGPVSEPVVAMTSEGVPNSAPLNVRCTTLTSQNIHVAWAPPNATAINGILRHYKILYKAASGWYEDEMHFINSTNSSVTLIDLEKYTNYSIQISAATKSGEGPLSEPIFCKTLDDVPDAPADVKAILTSESSVLVTWKAPLKPNGVIKSYNIYYRMANNVNDVTRNTLPAQYTQMEMPGLKKGSRYEFWVTAVNIAGEGKSSRTLSQSPNNNKVPAHIIPFDEKVIIPWKSDVTLSCQAVGNPIPKRSWYYKDVLINGDERLAVVSDGSLVVRDITEDESGDYYCIASNDFNEDRVTYTVIVLVPPSPPTIDILHTSSGSIEIRWKISRTGSSHIQGYVLHVRREFGDWKEITLDHDVASYRLNGLECGSNYEIAAAAFNKIGLGERSKPILVQTNGSVPGYPPKQDLLEETATSVSINLNSWKVHSCPIQYYIVEYKVKGSGDWISAANNVKPEQRRLVVRDLTPATWYLLRITAHSSAGSTTAEYDFATMTITGATISPNVMLKDGSGSNTASPKVDLWVAVSAILAVLVLIVLLALACLYIKRKKTYQGPAGKGMQCEVNQAMHRNTLSRPQTDFGTMSSAGYQDDPIPYATCHVGSHNLGTLPHRGAYPHIPDHQLDTMDSFGMQHKVMLVNGGFLPAVQVNPAETTFIFPQGPGGASNFPPPVPGFPN